MTLNNNNPTMSKNTDFKSKKAQKKIGQIISKQLALKKFHDDGDDNDDDNSDDSFVSEQDESSDDSFISEHDDLYDNKILSKKIYNTRSRHRNKLNPKKSGQIKCDDEDEDECEDDDEYEDDIEEEINDEKGNYTIILEIHPTSVDIDEYDDDYEDESNRSDTENEDDSVSSDDTDDENEETEIDECEFDFEPKRVVKKNENIKKAKKSEKMRKKEKKEKPTELKNEIDSIDEEEELLKLLAQLEQSKPSKLVNECIGMCKRKIEKNVEKQQKKAKKEKDRNVRIFNKITHDKNMMNDSAFFSKLDLPQQKKIIKELREINKIIRSEKPYKLTLLESPIPVNFKATAMKKIALLKNMDPVNGEYYKIKNWVDTFMRIPFGSYKTLPISLNNGIDNCHDFMENSRKILDSAVYGLDDAKMQIMQLLGQLVTNPSAVGSAIAIHGSPGVGKTSLVREGISKILDRPFAFIALGGATDSSFLEGHSYTYEGSSWGKIVQILIDSQCMNPVIYFDELDKVSETPRGDEIVGILTHLIDTTQNSQFHDKYFSEIDFDLSKCLFIFSYNDESKINPILKDRMYKIQIKNYGKKEKTIIANDYILPKIREQVKFNCGEITLTDEILHYIIDNYCGKEDGVRNLKRCLEIIHTKINLYRLVKPNSMIFEENSIAHVEFPLTITRDIVDKLIKKMDVINPSLSYMYI